MLCVRFMKEDDFVDLFKDNMKKSAASLAFGHCWFFQQDNEGKHMSKLIGNPLKDTKNW